MIMRNEYYFLSNMYPCTIKYNGHTFTCVESAFQAQKNPARAPEFEALNGYDAKRLGRKVKMRADWESVKLDIMKEILKIKFSDTTLANKLKSVKEPIVEENTWNDTFWGVCEGRGMNHLGMILEDIKKDLLKRERKTNLSMMLDDIEKDSSKEEHEIEL